MWRILRVGRIAFNSDTVSEEVILPTLQTMIALSSTFWFVFFVIAAAMPALRDVMPSLFLVVVVVALMTLLALRLMSHRVELGLSVWLLATTLGIVLVMYLLSQPQVVYFLAFVPFAASAILSWPAGIVAEVGITLLLIWFGSLPGITVLTGGAIAATVISGALAGIVGWASTTTSRSIALWSVRNYERIAEQVTEARRQRVEMKQVQEDLTQANRELARLTDRLRVLQHEADEARRAKEQFVANVSHELRTPLNMIIGFSEMITAAPQVYGHSLPPALLSDIEAIRVNSQHLSNLVDDVLDLSRIEAQRVVLMKESVAIKQVVEAAAVAVRPLFESKGLSLVVDLDPTLPPVMCDSTRIRQVILNLLSNAGRYTEHGGVTVHARRQDDEIVISVADTGPGISASSSSRSNNSTARCDASRGELASASASARNS